MCGVLSARLSVLSFWEALAKPHPAGEGSLGLGMRPLLEPRGCGCRAFSRFLRPVICSCGPPGPPRGWPAWGPVIQSLTAADPGHGLHPCCEPQCSVETGAGVAGLDGGCVQHRAGLPKRSQGKLFMLRGPGKSLRQVAPTWGWPW